MTTSFADNYAGNTPETLFSVDTLWIDWTASTPGWNGFDFDLPFTYNGGSNLIVEFRYMYSSGTTVNARAMNLPSSDRCLDAGYPNSSTGDMMSFLTNIRVHYTPTGIAEEDHHQSIPAVWASESPAVDLVTVNVLMPFAENAAVSLYSLEGSLVKSISQGYLTQGNHTLFADISDLPSGLYLLVLSTESTVSSSKLITLD